MLPYPKNLTLKKYQRSFLTFILTSEFIYSATQDISQIKRLRLNIKTKKKKKINYFYLWLLTGQMPQSRKFHFSWKKKKTSTNEFVKTKVKSNLVQVAIRSKNKFLILQEILFAIIAKQINYEKKIWNFKHQHIQILIPAAPLTRSTIFLQAKNSYFPNIPLILYVTFSNTTAFQKLFILRALKILTSMQQIKNLDFIE